MYCDQISRLYRSQIPFTGSSTWTKGDVPVISNNNRKKLYQTLLTKSFKFCEKVSTSKAEYVDSKSFVRLYLNKKK